MGGGSTKPEHMLIILPMPRPTKIIDRIIANHPQFTVTFKQTKLTMAVEEGEIPTEIYKDATILVTLAAVPPSPESCPKLELIHFLSAGTNHVANSRIYKETTIPLTTSSGIHGPQIAEWVVMTALANSHHFKLLNDWQKEHYWGHNLNSFGAVKDQVGSRLGILGYGSIGRQVGRMGKAMGMDVVAYTASPRDTPESKEDHGFIIPGTGDSRGEYPSAWYSGLDKKSLHNFLRQDIDILMISVPLTKATKHFLAKEEFEILGKSRNTFISNISRGQILEQDDLIAALKKSPTEGGLRGAALDVTDPEPLPESNELWSMPNVFITPHVSGQGAKYVDRSFAIVEINLDRRESGGKLLNIVDRERGY
ncbi:MAG: hypothetical protein M1827_004718 [Pycnora praestabilis]|nr:MAG: hypothetical protein M1827_004718 [Pycnora praestabilis]